MIIDSSRMASINGPGPDSEVAMETPRGTMKGVVSLVVVCGATVFDLFRVGETVRGDFRSCDELVARLNLLVEETQREFMERGLFSGLDPVQNNVECRFEERDGYGVLQVYCGSRRMLLFVDPDGSIEPLVRAMSQLLDGMQLPSEFRTPSREHDRERLRSTALDYGT